MERCTWLKRVGLLCNLAVASVTFGQYGPPSGPGGYPAMQAPILTAPVYAEDMAPQGQAYPANYGYPAESCYPGQYGSCSSGQGCNSAPKGLLSKFGCCLSKGDCDSACDCECGESCDGESCGGNCGTCGGCGGQMGCNCPTCSGLLSKCCLFCRGEGCYLCRGMAIGVPWEWLNYLRPYSQAGVAAQRWYDLSIGVTSLRRSAGSSMPLLTDRPGGSTLFSTGDLGTNRNRAGLYASAAVLFGVGGNVEATYFGLNDWKGERIFAPITPPGPLTPFSIGNVNFADLNGATAIGIREESAFHSTELNYRRRWVGPYGRFQGSWLFGTRYFDIDEEFEYFSRGPTNFSSLTKSRNTIVGGQIGMDLWWNVVPGVNLGVEYKYGLMGNSAQQETTLQSTTGAVTNLSQQELADDGKTTNMGEINATIIYRLSYSWSFRASYMFVNIEDVALASNNFNSTVNNTSGVGTFTGRPVSLNNDSRYRVEGWVFGAEYLW